MPKFRRILVTGADGFIGSHLVEALVRKGEEVRAFVYYNSNNSWGWLDHCAEDVKGKFEVISGDIRDPYGVREAVRDCDAVIHLAALIAIPYSYTSPDSYIDTNIKGTLNILQASKDFKVARVLQTSTSEVYGSAQYVPIDELHPLNGQSPYSATKIASDQLAHSFYCSFNLPVVTVRPFNTFGPRQSARAVIPTIISQIAIGAKELKIGSLLPTRDFSFVNDTVEGFISILDSDAGIGEVFNLGSNFEVSIGDTAHLIAKLMHCEINIKEDNDRLRPENSEVNRLWADNKKAYATFGWKPKLEGEANFINGLQATIKWFTNPDNLIKYKTDIYNR